MLLLCQIYDVRVKHESVETPSHAWIIRSTCRGYNADETDSLTSHAQRDYGCNRVTEDLAIASAGSQRGYGFERGGV
jgi:hypothetical protein